MGAASGAVVPPMLDPAYLRVPLPGHCLDLIGEDPQVQAADHPAHPSEAAEASPVPYVTSKTR